MSDGPELSRFLRDVSGQEGRKQYVLAAEERKKEKWAARNRTRTADTSVSRTARDTTWTVGRKESHAHRGRKRLAHRARHGQWATGDSGPDSPVPTGPFRLK